MFEAMRGRASDASRATVSLGHDVFVLQIPTLQSIPFFARLQVLDVIDRTNALENIAFPTSLPACAYQSDLFSRGGRNPLRGCLSAIDGIAVKIQRPSVQDAPNPMSYYNRKGFFALNARAAVGV